MQFTNFRPLLYVRGLSVNCKQFIKLILRLAFTRLLVFGSLQSKALPRAAPPCDTRTCEPHSLIPAMRGNEG